MNTERTKGKQMKTYTATLSFSLYEHMTVEAENEDQAKRLMNERFGLQRPKHTQMEINDFCERDHDEVPR